MMLRAMRADWLKLKGKGFWFLVCLGPVGLIAMQALNFGLRYDYLKKLYADDLWGGLLDNMAVFVPIALLMGITILCSLIANIEHNTSSWKQLLALPISRTAVFFAKFAVAVIMLGVSCVLLALGTAALGLGLGFGSPLPLADIAKLGFYPFIAALPLLALLLWMCLTLRNQAIPITLGVVLAVLSMFAIAEWLPLTWPLLAYKAQNQEIFLAAGALGGFIVLLAGTVHFARRDVN
ncbi:permease [Paenibacillus sp. 1011MAR3C5]|uniref:ABC transporter permease n=1 Tax=Paenibacillus sp. 1011MAR3C5 TaxID=1675787 RepID=UPI000E6BFC0B|nr:ABC transporter permease [Paenibacillus sp. 1011MAR3C5]RJE84386.1 permease [Paenibacillus sp. 1011MAR3C5]